MKGHILGDTGGVNPGCVNTQKGIFVGNLTLKSDKYVLHGSRVHVQRQTSIGLNEIYLLMHVHAHTRL